MRPSAASLLLAPLLLAACVSDSPNVPTPADASGTVDVEILGDGFVRTDGRRIPMDAFILEMRMRMRTMTPEQRDLFLVTVTFAPSLDGAAAESIAHRDRDRLLEQCDIMDVGVVKLL